VTAKRFREGYLLIDNRDAEPVAGVARFVEAGTTTCRHCHKQVLRDPGAEIEKFWCPGCDSYLCKGCKAIAVVAGCKPFDKVIEEQSRHLDRSLILV
jgi:hypothetical protein